MKKIEMIMNSGDMVEFDTVPELLDYIAENQLLVRGFESKNLLKIWEHDNEKLFIETNLIQTIIIREVYKAEVCHHKTYTFHTYEQFEDFMVSMGATPGNVRTRARYGIYGGEIVTSKYDCVICSIEPNYKEWK